MTIRPFFVTTALVTVTLFGALSTNAGAAAIRHAPTPFTITGKVTAVSIKKNTVTVTVGKTRYSVLVNSTTVFTVRSKHANVRKLVVGEHVRVVGEHLGPLYLGLRVIGS